MVSAERLNALPKLVAGQEWLRPYETTVMGSVDYRTWRERLNRVDELLRVSGAEEVVIRMVVARRQLEIKEAAAREGGPDPGMSEGAQVKLQRAISTAVRTTIGRSLKGCGYREFATYMAESELMQRFCRIDRLGTVYVPSKSQLQRNAEMLEEGEIREVVDQLLKAAADGTSALRLKEAVDVKTWLVDSTCVKLNIHYPTDWVLLRDAGRTLMKATMLIRGRGLKERMKEPSWFLGRMNGLAMEMGKQSRRAAGKKKERKKLLRKMKKLAKCMGGHAKRHRDLLEKEWEKTDLSQKEAAQIIGRIDTMLERLPEAIQQAHERIIGERQVANEEKILSLYEGHAAVYVRGKAGAEVEFGSQLLIAETRSGVIADWELVCGNPEHDTALLERSLKRGASLGVKTVGGDRGFDSKKMRGILEENKIENGIARRNGEEAKKKSKEPVYVELQKRRAQTEGRISIVKNYVGKPLLAKGHRNQARQVAWSMLAHNLWVLAGLAEKESAMAAAA